MVTSNQFRFPIWNWKHKHQNCQEALQCPVLKFTFFLIWNRGNGKSFQNLFFSFCFRSKNNLPKPNSLDSLIATHNNNSNNNAMFLSFPLLFLFWRNCLLLFNHFISKLKKTRRRTTVQQKRGGKTIIIEKKILKRKKEGSRLLFIFCSSYLAILINKLEWIVCYVTKVWLRYICKWLKFLIKT